MKKYGNYLILIVIVLVVLILSLLIVKPKEKNVVKPEDKYMEKLPILDNYDIAITRRDINCAANTIYLNKDEIYIVNYNGNVKEEIARFSFSIDIDSMIEYVRKNGNDGLEGLKVTLKDGTTKVIEEVGNVVSDFLIELSLGSSYCDKSILNKTTTCEYKPKLLLTKDNINIYTYCLDANTINMNGKKVDIKNYIENNDNAIDNIINTLKFDVGVYDGGTKIYKGDITLIKCNTMAGNKDIYITNKDMDMKSSFCKNDNSTFIRTYTIKDISLYTEQRYTEDGTPFGNGNAFKVTLAEFQGETKTLILDNIWDIILEKNKTYEFELMTDNKDINDDIESIFNNSRIVEIRETKKAGLEQIRESIR